MRVKRLPDDLSDPDTRDADIIPGNQAVRLIEPGG